MRLFPIRFVRAPCVLAAAALLLPAAAQAQSLSLNLGNGAAGGAVVYAQPLLQPWDVAAGALLCTETGVVLTRMDGSAFDVRRAGSLLVGSPAAHAEVLEYLRSVRG